MSAMTMPPRHHRRWRWRTPQTIITRTTLDHTGFLIQTWGLAGGRSERIALDEIESASLVRRSKQDRAALALRLQSGRRVLLKVKGAALWKYDVEQLCGFDVQQAAVPREDREPTSPPVEEQRASRTSENWPSIKTMLADDDYPFDPQR